MLRTEGWLQEFFKCHKIVTKKGRHEMQKWKRHVEGWVKCNFDRAWNQRQNWDGFRIVLHNHLGEFLSAAVGLIDRATSALYAEFIAARQAVQIVNRLYSVEVQVQFEGDAVLVLSAIKG